jgi:hypothetical protein
MPLYAISNTKEGNRALELYDGENDKVTFLQAILLARATEGIVNTSEIYRFLHEEYPTTLATGAITSAILKLESYGYVKVYRDVTLDTHINVDILGVKLPTTLGDFLNANVKNHSMPISRIADKLKWEGRIELTVNAPTDTGQMQVVMSLR